MYSFAQRADTSVCDEPLYAHYLKSTPANEYHPGATDILASMEKDGEKVIDMMMGLHEKPVVFFKNMTHHLLGLDRSFMKNTVNVILTRNPLEMLPSFAEVIENPTMDDVGYALHINLVESFQEVGIKPIVFDSKDILMNPEKALTRMCNEASISFDKNMLSWPAGARNEDGIWAKYWYKNVHKSKGFMEYKPKTAPYPNRLKPLLDLCMPHYEKLLQLA
ncbi:MAG: sulfotransferase family protein [Flavobacteriales bacterium]|nr:sulfotransferase family protein [Flavobacteriales bacterium]